MPSAGFLYPPCPRCLHSATQPDISFDDGTTPVARCAKCGTAIRCRIGVTYDFCIFYDKFVEDWLRLRGFAGDMPKAWLNIVYIYIMRLNAGMAGVLKDDAGGEIFEFVKKYWDVELK